MEEHVGLVPTTSRHRCGIGANVHCPHIKQHDSTHVVAVPHLLTPRWPKQLFKVCDILLVILAGTPGWAADMLEPLLIGICFPFLRFKPWQIRGTPKMFLWHRTCIVCSKPMEWTQGLFCANFGRITNGCVPCRQMWYPGCYTSSQLVMFHIAKREG
jgi:hypothetical protein